MSKKPVLSNVEGPAAETPETPTTVPVVVIVDTHTHQGAPVAKGATIEVTPDEQAFLLQHHVIEEA